MANNPYVNKVNKADGTTIIDITDTTATASDVAQGKYFYLATGQKVEGSASGGAAIITDTTDANGGTIREITTSDEVYLQSSKSVTPTESAQTVEPDTGYDALESVAVGAISSTYVGSGITQRSSTDLSASGATVTAPAGYYSSSASKSVSSMTLPTSAASSATSGYSSKATISRSTSDQYINIPTGYNSTGAYYKVSATANGSVTAPSTISGTGASVTTGTNTLTLSKTVSVTPSVTTAGYVSSGTAGNSAVSLTASVNTRSSSDLTASGATVTAPAGYYSSAASKTVSSGTAGTPTATKGTVSNHTITVTPSVTNTTGYITGSTKTGTGVTVSASELVSGTKSITANGTDIDVAEYATVDVAVSGGGGSAEKKDVNFYDYDGTILYSYTSTEVQDLTALPSNPTHSGLTSQGWNYTLAEIKSEVTSKGMCDVGQMYITDNGATRLYCHFEDTAKTPLLGLNVDGSVTVDWGDSSATETLTGSGTNVTSSHTYSTGGDYVISINIPNGSSVRFFGVSANSYLMRHSTSTTSGINRVYSNAIKKIELGSGSMTIEQYAFTYCSGLETITLPKNVDTSFGQYAFSYCYALKHITIPSGITTTGQYCFYYCGIKSVSIPSGMETIGNDGFYYTPVLNTIAFPNSITALSSYSISYSSILEYVGISSNITQISAYFAQGSSVLKAISIPHGVTSIGTYAFSNCYSLSEVTIPSTVATIDARAFYNCYGVSEYHLLGTTPPTLSNTNAFTGIQSGTIIYVPASALSNYQTASNWSTYASYMQGE